MVGPITSEAPETVPCSLCGVCFLREKLTLLFDEEFCGDCYSEALRMVLDAPVDNEV